MKECPFCKLDKNDIVNTILDESNNFLVLPTKGAFCDGYLLIVPKKHINSMNELTDEQKDELINLIDTYRKKFKDIFGEYPLLFEHGSSSTDATTSSSSIRHAHIHIVNHKFKAEQNIISTLNMNKVSLQEFFEFKDKNYISYISNNREFFITYNFKPVSQQMRIYIAEDLGILNNFNWRENNFDSNILKTIEKFKK